MTDKILIENYLSGDEYSLEVLLEKHLQSIFSACFRVCLDETNANDITQNVVLKIIKNLDKFSFESEFSTWYYRIAYNESITFLKKDKGCIEIEEIENKLIYDDNPGKNIDQKTLNIKVNEEINSLPIIDRNIILYFYYEELKIKEIASILNLNENTVKTKLSRAKEKLKHNFKSHENIN